MRTVRGALLLAIIVGTLLAAAVPAEAAEGRLKIEAFEVVPFRDTTFDVPLEAGDYHLASTFDMPGEAIVRAPDGGFVTDGPTQGITLLRAGQSGTYTVETTGMGRFAIVAAEHETRGERADAEATSVDTFVGRTAIAHPASGGVTTQEVAVNIEATAPVTIEVYDGRLRWIETVGPGPSLTCTCHPGRLAPLDADWMFFEARTDAPGQETVTVTTTLVQASQAGLENAVAPVLFLVVIGGAIVVMHRRSAPKA